MNEQNELWKINYKNIKKYIYKIIKTWYNIINESNELNIHIEPWKINKDKTSLNVRFYYIKRI